MAYGKRLLFEDMRSVSAATIAAAGATYSAIGSAIQYPARIIKIDNTTDAPLKFSIDGNNDHFMMPAASSMIIDVSANQPMDNPFFFAQGTVLYVQEINASPTAGDDVYFSVVYGKGD